MSSKPLIAVFSGPRATISNSPTLVTSNKARLETERKIDGQFDHLVPQILYEPVTVKIRKFSAHPLEKEAASVYHDNGKDYYEVTLTPEDGPYLLPYMARRADGSKTGTPFESSDLTNSSINFGGRQSFYPDAQRIFEEIDRTISGRSENGEGNQLNSKAEYDFIRVLPSGGYASKGEVSGVDYFPYQPRATAKSARYSDLARVANRVQEALSSGRYTGSIWLEGSPHLEETLYWLNLIIDSDLPIVGNAAQRTHGQLSNDGDRNIVDSVDLILSGKGKGLGAVALQDQVIFSSREFKKGDDRPGGYKATGGHGGILGTVKSGDATIWYKPNYKHTSSSEVNLSKLRTTLNIDDEDSTSPTTSLGIKDSNGALIGEIIPRVQIVKYTHYSQEDASENPEQEVMIMAWIKKAELEQKNQEAGMPKLHGIVLEGTSPYATGSAAQMKALRIAALSGIPVVRVGRSDPGGRVPTNNQDMFIEGSNLDANKARILLIASMLKLGRFPKAKDPKNPSSREAERIVEKAVSFQKIFEVH